MLKKVSINSESDRLSLSLSHELMLLLLTAGKRLVDSSMTGWSQLVDLLEQLRDERSQSVWKSGHSLELSSDKQNSNARKKTFLR